MEPENWRALREAGVVRSPEYLNQRIWLGEQEEYAFSPAQAREAARLGITVRTWVDAVLEDRAARAEAIARLNDHH